MDTETTEEQDAFTAFAAELKKRYEPDRVILFGSRAKGEVLKDSDYDILIVSKKFRGIPFTDRMTAIYRSWPLRVGLDCICLTPEEYDKSVSMITLTREIAREGIQL